MLRLVQQLNTAHHQYISTNYHIPSEALLYNICCYRVGDAPSIYIAWRVYI